MNYIDMMEENNEQQRETKVQRYETFLQKKSKLLPPSSYILLQVAGNLQILLSKSKKVNNFIILSFSFLCHFKGKHFENSVEERESYKEETGYDGCSGFKQQITTERLRVVPILRYSLPQKTVARGNIPTTSLAGGEFGGVVYLVKRRHQPSKPAPLLLRQNGLSSRK